MPELHSRTNGADDLITLYSSQREAQRQRYESQPFEEYYRKLLSGEIPPPARNSADLAFRALTTEPPTYHPAGYWEYGAFNNEEDGLAIYGIPRSIDQIMRFLKASAAMDSRDRILLLVAPTGAGKSTAVDIITRRLERYTAEADPPPVFALEGCPLNENPLHLLDRNSRKLLKDRYKIAIKGELCPDCQSREDKDLRVKAVRFSASAGRGISRLEPRMTRHTDPVTGQANEKTILSSNRGILHLPEFCQHQEAFLRALNDLWRGRRLVHQGKIYLLDNLIIGDTTREEWEGFQNKQANASLVARIEPIYITYPLSRSAEVRVYQKSLSASGSSGLPHLSPQTLECAAEFAVRTRYTEGAGENCKAASIGEKVSLYDGINAGELNQNDRPAIEAEGRNNNEGLKGFPPPAVMGLLNKLIAERMTERPGEADAHPCLDPIEVIKEIKRLLRVKSDQAATNQLTQVEAGYNLWILRIAEQAFHDNYPGRANKAISEYLRNCELELDPLAQAENDPLTGERVKADQDFMESLEDGVQPVPIDRHQFRRAIYETAGRITLEKGREPDFTDFPQLHETLKNLLARGAIKPEETLKAIAPTEKQAERLGEAEERLVREYGFCPTCAHKLIRYAGNLLRERDKDDLPGFTFLRHRKS